MSMSSTIARLDVIFLGECDLSFDFIFDKNIDIPLFPFCYVLSKAVFLFEEAVGEGLDFNIKK